MCDDDWLEEILRDIFNPPRDDVSGQQMHT